MPDQDSPLVTGRIGGNKTAIYLTEANFRLAAASDVKYIARATMK